MTRAGLCRHIGSSCDAEIASDGNFSRRSLEIASPNRRIAGMSTRKTEGKGILVLLLFMSTLKRGSYLSAQTALTVNNWWLRKIYWSTSNFCDPSYQVYINELACVAVELEKQ